METSMMGTSRSASPFLITVSGAAGIMALFLPFAGGASPVATVIELFHPFSTFLSWQLKLLAIPFFLSVLISAAFVRWMISGLLPRRERAIAYVVGSMMAFVSLNFIIRMFLEYLLKLSFKVRFWLVVVIPLMTIVFGVYVVIKNLMDKGPKEVSAVMAMQIAYLSNSLLCLFMFYEYLQTGAYYVIITCGVYLIQIVLMSIKRGVCQDGGANSNP